MPTDVLIADFVVSTPEERDYELGRAFSSAKFKAAINGKLGIIITRHDFSRFSVSLSPAVPFGDIHECDYAQRD